MNKGTASLSKSLYYMSLRTEAILFIIKITSVLYIGPRKQLGLIAENCRSE